MIKMKKPKYKENETFQLLVLMVILIIFYITIILGILALLIYMFCGHVDIDSVIGLFTIMVTIIMIYFGWFG